MEDKRNDSKIINALSVFNAQLAYLLNKWRIVLLLSFCASVIGICYAWLLTPKYTAEIVFTSESDRSGQASAYAGIAAQFGIDIGSGNSSAFQGDNLIELFKTRKVVEKTLLTPYRDKLVIDYFIANHKLDKKWQKIPGFANVKFLASPASSNRLRDSLQTVVFEEIVKKNLTVDRTDKRLSFISISMIDENEQFAADFVNLLAQNTIAYYTEYRTKKAKENFEVLQKQTDSVKALLFGNIENYAESNDLNVNPLKQKAKVGSQKVQVNISVNTALYTELLKQLGLAKVTLDKSTPLIQVIDEPVLPLKTNKKSRLMTGLLFGFIGGLVTVIGLLILRFIKRLLQVQKKTGDSND